MISTKRPWAAGTSAVGCAAQSATAARTATSDKRFIYLCPFRRLRRREPPPQHEIAPPEYPSDVLGAYLELVRPANVATALGDVLAGFAVAGLGNPGALPWLLVSTACLYAGGVVLNDVFDRHVDAVERPERPLPSGRVAASHAAVLGPAFWPLASWRQRSARVRRGRVALAIAASVLLYDGWSKKNPVLGPLNMGACRGLNLGLGMAAVPGTLGGLLAAVPDSHGLHRGRDPAQPGRGLGRPALRRPRCRSCLSPPRLPPCLSWRSARIGTSGWPWR